MHILSEILVFAAEEMYWNVFCVDVSSVRNPTLWMYKKRKIRQNPGIKRGLVIIVGFSNPKLLLHALHGIFVVIVVGNILRIIKSIVIFDSSHVSKAKNLKNELPITYYLFFSYYSFKRVRNMLSANCDFWDFKLLVLWTKFYAMLKNYLCIFVKYC